MKKLRAGIIGLGRIASLYEDDAKARRWYPALTHAGSYAAHPRVELAAGCDTLADRRRDFSRRWGVRAVYAGPAEMLRRESLDIVSVCAPPEAHAAAVREAAGRVRAIFCEKPMGRSLAEARSIAALCRKRRTPLAVNLYRLFDPAHREAIGRVRRGELGRIQRVNCFYGKGLRNQGAHLVSLLIGFFGPIRSVRALDVRRQPDSPEPVADFTLAFLGGVRAVVQACDFRRYRIFELDILGEKGRAILDREGFGLRFYRRAPNRAETGAYELRPAASIKPTVGRAMYWAVDNLVQCIEGRAELLGSGDDFVETARVLDAVLRSGRQGGRSVEIA